MISVQQALKIHTIAIENFGRADGVRGAHGLESALAHPFQTFDSRELYPSIFEKAASLGESIIVNHPFIDGNKRTGYLMMEALLRVEGYFIKASNEDLFNFVIDISTGAISYNAIADWLKANTKQVNK